MALLEKNLPLNIDKENPFKEDCLDRKTIVENLTTLINTLTQPFVISIEAPWGSGKTTFIKMWKQYLENNNHPSLYFNAWENDFAVDPLIAFLGEMSKLLDQEENKDLNPKLQKSFEQVKDIGGKLIRRTIPVAVRIATQGIITEDVIHKIPGIITDASDEIGVLFGEIAKDSIKAFVEEKKSVQTFKEELENFSRLIVDQGKTPPIVIFIDELDRCRPSYAIELLERIKHLFNIPGVVFILSLDRQQLENSVAATYGSNINANGYLARFIDYRFRLPEIKNDKFVISLIKRFSIDEFFTMRARMDPGNNNYTRVFLENVLVWFNIHKLSLRLQEQCFSEMNLVLRMIPSNLQVYPSVIPFLATLKLASPEKFDNLANKTISTEDLFNSILKSTEGKEFWDDYFGGYLEGIICQYLCTEQQINEKFNHYVNEQKIDLSLRTQSVTNEHIRGFSNCVQGEKSLYHRHIGVGYLIKIFSIAEEISITE